MICLDFVVVKITYCYPNTIKNWRQMFDQSERDPPMSIMEANFLKVRKLILQASDSSFSTVSPSSDQWEIRRNEESSWSFQETALSSAISALFRPAHTSGNSSSNPYWWENLEEPLYHLILSTTSPMAHCHDNSAFDTLSDGKSWFLQTCKLIWAYQVRSWTLRQQ